MIYFLRHGKDDESFVGGHSNASLTEEGKKEIEEIGKFIKENIPIKKIYTSDITRAKQTAKIVNKYLNVPLIEDKKLRELDKGLLTGKLKTSLTEKEYKNLKTQDINEKIIGGESMQDFFNRITSLFESGYFNDKEDTLIVTHRGVINMLYYYLKKDPLTMDKKKYGVIHGSIHILDIKNKDINKF